MSPYGNALLTGATGFLGAHLLARLLSTGTQHVLCHVRASDKVSGKARLIDNLARYRLWREEWVDRISALPGDLAAPDLGLGGVYRCLPDKVDAIYHNGAHVNYILNYAQLKATNVGATQHLIRLAQAGGIPLFYLSTLRMFDHRVDGRPIREDDDVDLKAVLANGYAYSKAMAERMVTAAAGQGLRAAIFRPGLLWGNGQTGLPNTQDAISLLVRGCVSAGCAPLSRLQVNLTSVDHAVEGLVALSYDARTLGHAWHLVHDEATPIDRLMHALRRAGHTMELMPYEAWVARLKAARANADNALNPLLGYFSPGFPEESTRRVFESRRTHDALAARGITHPVIDDTYIDHNIQGMVDIGFLPAAHTAPDHRSMASAH